MNCFGHCGMQATVTEPTENPFADLDENKAQLEDLVEQLQPGDCMTVGKYAAVDNEVASCATFESSEKLREMVVSNGHQLKRTDNEDADDKSDGELPQLESPHTLKQSNLTMTC